MENLETKTTKLVALYFLICEFKSKSPEAFILRKNPLQQGELSDEEALTIYIFGLLEGRDSCKKIYEFIKVYWRDWFPNLGSYQAFNERINRLLPCLFELIGHLNKSVLNTANDIFLVDSLPAPISNGKRLHDAKVAKTTANIGFCAAKNMHYYGLKVHIIAAVRPETTPVPVGVWISKASLHDIQFLKKRPLEQENCLFIADKAYQSKKLSEDLKAKFNIDLITLLKKPKGKDGKENETHNKKYGAIRQPIESLFNQIQELAQCFNLSKSRSLQGAKRKVLGGIAAFLVQLALSSMLI